jgi:hypothetical protein
MGSWAQGEGLAGPRWAGPSIVDVPRIVKAVKRQNGAAAATGGPASAMADARIARPSTSVSLYFICRRVQLKYYEDEYS